MTTILLACVLLLAWPSQAQAIFLAPLVATTFAISLTAATVILTVASVAISIGISYAANKLLAKDPQQAPEAGGVQLDLRIDVDLPEVLILGRAVTAGSLAHRETYGKRGAIDNSDMVEVIAIADHPITGFVKTFVEEREAEYTAPNPELEVAMRAYGVFAEHRGLVVNGYNGKLAIQHYDGTQTAADLLAVAALGAHPARPWTAAHVGRGRAYARIHSIFDKELVQGPLTWRFVVDGIPLYDPRKDTTVGGSGSHRFNDLATHEFTANLPVIAYNILRGIRVKDSTGTPRHFYGIENGSAASCPLDSWFAAMNEADVMVDGEPQFHGGGEISVDTEPLDTIRQIVKACAGRFSELGGVYKLRLGAPGLPVLTITDGDLRANAPDEYRPILPQEERVNYITGKYTAPEEGWVPKVAPVRTDAAMELADGKRLFADLDVPMVQSAAHCQRLMQNLLMRSRRERRHSPPLPPAAFGLEPGDVIDWTSAEHGYVDKLFEVDAADLLPDLDSVAAVTEVDHDDYDWDGETDFVDQPVGTLEVDRPAPKIIEGFDADGFRYTGDGGRDRPAIRVTWTLPDDGDVARVEVKLRRSPGIPEEATFSTDEPAAVEMIILAGLSSDTQYQVRGRFVSFNGYAAEWSLWIDVTTPVVELSFSEIAAELRSAISRVTQRVEGFEDYVGGLIGRLGAVEHASDTSRSRDIVSVEARVGENVASVTQAFEAFVGPDGAFATYQLAVEAQFEGVVSSVSETAEAVVTLDGAVAALWTLKVDANGNIAKIMLGADEDESDIFLLADNILFKSPGYPDLAFLFGTINGAPGFGFSGGSIFLDGQVYITQTAHMADAIVTTAKIGNAQITNAKIGTAEVSDLKIVGASIAVADATTNPNIVPGNNVSFQDICVVSLSFTNTVNGSKIPLVVGAQFGVHASGTPVIQWALIVNGATVQYDFWLPPGAGDLTGISPTVVAYVTGNGGTVNVTVTLQVQSTSTSFVHANALLVAAGFKR